MSNLKKILFGVAILIFLATVIAAQSDFLPPEQAFPLSAEAGDAHNLSLIWSLPPGYYLYREKFRFHSETPGITLGEAIIPPGAAKEDEFFGAIHTLHGLVEVTIPINNPTSAPQIKLNVSSQGCADAGLCYPPIQKVLEIDLPIAPTIFNQSTIIPTPPQKIISEQERLEKIIAGGNLPLLMTVFFGIGLLLAFTPCVFPMIPILSGIIVGHGANLTTRKAFLLSLVYVLAMALTYAGAGIIAGRFGANLQVTFQNPWVISGFSGIFILLALSMFGLYELQIPSAWQTRLSELSNRQVGGTWLGVAVMGILSALIVGPCVAPPLAAALLFIGQTGDALLGGLALFALALGMGAPLIIIGTTAGRFLPRAGNWMNAVKAIFGVGLLGVAILLLERIVPPTLTMIFWSALLIISAVFLGAVRATRPEDNGWTRLAQGLGLIILIYGTLILIGVAAGGNDSLRPLRGIFSSAPHTATLQFRRIKTVADLDREINLAQGRTVMLDFYADWCVSCKEMERDTFSEPAVISVLANVIKLQADVTANDVYDQELIYGRFGIPGPPAILFFGTDGNERIEYRIIGAINTADFIAHVRNVITK